LCSAHTHALRHTRTHTHTHAHAHTHTHAQARTSTRARTRTRARAHTHTHIQYGVTPGWKITKMHRECERRLDIIKGNDRMVHKLSNATSDLAPRFANAPVGEARAHVQRSLNADKRKRDLREIEVLYFSEKQTIMRRCTRACLQ